jgi:hypothetical protein
MGILPSSAAEVKHILEWQEALQKIRAPLSDEEAVALISLFPAEEDDCFGLAWSLLHLIETAPHWPIDKCLENTINNPWVILLRQRALGKGRGITP